MEREEFNKEIEAVQDKFDHEWIAWYVDRIDAAIQVNRQHPIEPPDQRQIVIAMEELSELTKELSKVLRGRGDRTAIIEEIADVQIVMNMLQMIFGITGEEINRAQTVKLKRFEERISVEGFYQ